MKACVFNLQKFSLHDGPGIRTVVFFKGCPLRCKWCSNPESQVANIQITYQYENCIKCDTCINNNKAQNISFQNGLIRVNEYDENENYETLCPQGVFQVEGQMTNIDDIMKEVIKDYDFYEESGGGVTLSGGEVLNQADFAIDLLKTLKKENIHTAAETTGFSDANTFMAFISNLDLILYDLKHYNKEKHILGCGVSNEQIIKNMKMAVTSKVPIIARIPVIPEYNDSLEDAKEFSKLLKEIGIHDVNLLPFHQYGSKKYDTLGLDYKFKDVKQLFPEDLEDYRMVMIEEGLNCYF